jgi:hypothetical protein
MIVSVNDLEQIFDEDVPESIQKALIQCLFSAYRVAFEECSYFPDEKTRDLRNFCRWVQLRVEMRGLGERFEGVTATVEPYHTLLIAKRVKLTACSLREADGLIRSAVYRSDYAVNSNLDLFIPHAPPPDDAYVYAVLLHGIDPTQPNQPAFGKIAFPTQDLQTHLHEIDLFDRHRELVTSLRAPVAVESEQTPKVRVRRSEQEV